MKKPALFLILALLAPTLTAQEGAISSPASEAKVRIRTFFISDPQPPASPSGFVIFARQTSGNVDLTEFTVFIPSASATMGGLMTAMVTVAAGETGNDGRKVRFRVHKYLFDQGALPGTVAPTP